MMANLKIVTDSSSTMEPSLRDAWLSMSCLICNDRWCRYPDDETLPEKNLCK